MDRRWMTTVAGVLDILSGVLALVGVLALCFASYMIGAVPDEDEVPLWAVQSLVGGLGVLLLVAAVVAVIGGVFALQHRRFGWMIAGSIAAAFCVAPLGVPAIILTVLAEREVEPPPPAPGPG